MLKKAAEEDDSTFVREAMIETFWFGANALIGLPIGLVLIMLAREVLRALVALAFGFRVFEIKWGFGRVVGTKSIGPIEWVRGAMPLGASIRAESGQAKRHRLGGLAQAGLPLSIQIVVALALNTSSEAAFDTLTSGFAPLAGLRLANLLLIAVHALFAVESAAGDQTDVRQLLDLAFAPAEASRHARARYYARYARHWLERGDVERAKAILDQGVTQLAHDPLVVACKERVVHQDLRSVVDQGACSRALQIMIEDDAPRRREASRAATLPERLRRSAISALPLIFAALICTALATESIARFAHHRLVVSSSRVADRGRPDDCEAALVGWSRWTPLISASLASDAEILRDRHAGLARLEACRGHLEEAVAHQAVANEAADQALSQHADDGGIEDAERRLRDEIGRAALLRRTAEFESRRHRYRVALATLARASLELDTTRKRLAYDAESPDLMNGESSLEGERARIEVARSEILARMQVN